MKIRDIFKNMADGQNTYWAKTAYLTLKEEKDTLFDDITTFNGE